MSAACLPISASYFVASREQGARLQIRLSRNLRCVLVAENDGVKPRLQMLFIAAKIWFMDRFWYKTEKKYFASVDLWIKGDCVLEEFISDNPQRYYDVDVQSVISERKRLQEKLITTGQMILALSLEKDNLFRHHNPLVNSERIESTITMLKDDLEGAPEPYFELLAKEEREDERQPGIGLIESSTNYEV